MYFPHRSPSLIRAFTAKPFQGAQPEEAKFLFVGLDANYDENIERSPIFPQLLEYLENGPEFWRKHGIHHPFLLPEYRGDGRFYHESFSKIGFSTKYAEDVSFIEMLHLPTYETSSLVPRDLDRHHLRRINDAILYGTARYIFIPGGVGRLMRASGEFPWLPKTPKSTGARLKLWHKTAVKAVYWHYHFSVYGKFQQEKMNQLAEMSQLLEL